MNTYIKIIFCIFLFTTCAFSQEEEYTVYDEEGVARFIITGPGVKKLNDIDSEVTVKASSFSKFFDPEIKIEGEVVGKKQLNDLGLSVQPVEEGTAEEAVEKRNSPFTSEEFSAAVLGLYGDDGAAFFRWCDEGSSFSSRLSWILTEELPATKTFKFDSESLELKLNNGKTPGGVYRNPFDAAQDFATFVLKDIEGSNNAGHQAWLIIRYGDDFGPLGDLKFREYLDVTFPKLLSDGGSSIATLANVYFSLPGLLNPGYSFAFMVRDGMEGDWMAAVEALPLLKTVAGGGLKVVRMTSSGRKTIDISSQTIAWVKEAIAAGGSDLADRANYYVSKFRTIPNPTNEMYALRNSLCRGTFCFPSGTRVWTPNGAVQIEMLSVGQEVFSWDLINAHLCIGKVLTRSTSDAPYTIKSNFINDNAELASLISTGDHPIAIQNSDSGVAWVPAECVMPGDQLLSVFGHTTYCLSHETEYKAQRVWSLSLSGPHNYFVETGPGWTLVHNSTSCLREQLKAWKKTAGSIGKYFSSKDPDVIRDLLWIKTPGKDWVLDTIAWAKMRTFLYKKGLHEWIPRSMVKEIYAHSGGFANPELPGKLVELLDETRISTSKLWFNNKNVAGGAMKGFGATGKPLGHVGKCEYLKDVKYDQALQVAFHDELRTALRESININGTFSRDQWISKLHDIASSYFAGAVLEGIRMDLDKVESAAMRIFR